MPNADEFERLASADARLLIGTGIPAGPSVLNRSWGGWGNATAVQAVTKGDLRQLLAQVSSPLPVLKWIGSRGSTARKLKKLSDHIENAYWNEHYGFLVSRLVGQLTDAWRPEFNAEDVGEYARLAILYAPSINAAWDRHKELRAHHRSLLAAEKLPSHMRYMTDFICDYCMYQRGVLEDMIRLRESVVGPAALAPFVQVANHRNELMSSRVLFTLTAIRSGDRSTPDLFARYLGLPDDLDDPNSESASLKF